MATAVVAAGGAGERLGAGAPKALVPLARQADDRLVPGARSGALASGDAAR